MTEGHVFVVQGKIGQVVADAAVVPTDASFSVREYWREAIAPEGDLSVEKHKPQQWSSTGWGRSRANAPVWFINVTSDRIDDRDAFDRLGEVLKDIGGSQLEAHVKGRPLPLVVLPVISTAGGGSDHERGRVIDRLLEVCLDLVAEHRIDAAIVTPDPASYAALQHRRRESVGRYFGNLDLEPARRLGTEAREGSLALFIGAGTSIPAGAPGWETLLEGLSKKAELSEAVLNSLGKLNPLDQAELLQQNFPRKSLGTAVKDLIKVKQPAIAHTLLAALGCQAAVTTNYDNLYEAAVAARGGSSLAVLPTRLPQGSDSWLLKMHGDLDHPESIVLTRGQFANFDATSGPSGAVLQSLLLTKHLLLVGTSMADDNVLRLIHQVVAYRKPQPQKDPEVGPAHEEKLGTILDVGGEPARELLHSPYFSWHAMVGEKLPERARQLEIFLDAVAMYASRDHSWLLDPRFSFLLDGKDDQALVADVVAVASRVQERAKADGAWEALAQRLTAFGAPARTAPK